MDKLRDGKQQLISEVTALKSSKEKELALAEGTQSEELIALKRSEAVAVLQVESAGVLQKQLEAKITSLKKKLLLGQGDQSEDLNALKVSEAAAVRKANEWEELHKEVSLRQTRDLEMKSSRWVVYYYCHS
jgi:hypothetical protein